MSHAPSDSELLEPDDLRTEVRHRPGSLPNDDAVKSLYIWCKRSPRPVVNRYTTVVMAYLSARVLSQPVV